jgi:hypothetical protein
MLTPSSLRSGPDCIFKHKIPDEGDERRLSNTKDIFGRDRFATDRDVRCPCPSLVCVILPCAVQDMGGVGSFTRENKTLYINGLMKPKEVCVAATCSRRFALSCKHRGRTCAGLARVRGACSQAVQRVGARGAGQSDDHHHVSSMPCAPSEPSISLFAAASLLCLLRRSKPYMFVTYERRSSAEFAKEAMTNQDLGHGELLNVR